MSITITITRYLFISPTRKSSIQIQIILSIAILSWNYSDNDDFWRQFIEIFDIKQEAIDSFNTLNLPKSLYIPHGTSTLMKQTISQETSINIFNKYVNDRFKYCLFDIDQKRIPLTALYGCSGSGKTRLLMHITDNIQKIIK